MSAPLKYLQHYPIELQDKVRHLQAQYKLGAYIAERYADTHQITSDKALFEFANQFKQQYLKNAPPLAKVHFDNRLTIDYHALGLNTAISRVQGGKLKAKKEIKVAALFKHAPEAFLKMIVVHELVHLKEHDHNKAFYQLCAHIMPSYHQVEFDCRVYLFWQEELLLR
jgi:UTP pyrophosphatase